MCQTLPLLPHATIEEGYNSIVQYADENNVAQFMEPFLNYVQRVWITGVGVQSFSVYKQRRRTNNDMESFHRKLISVMGRPHPNVWIFTDKLRSLEYEYCNKFATLQRGLNAARPAPPSTVLADARLQALTARLDSGAYTTIEFLQAASHHLDNVHNEIFNGDDVEDDIEGIVAAWLPPDPDPPRQRAAGRGRAGRRGRRGRAVGGRIQGRGEGRRRRGQANPIIQQEIAEQQNGNLDDAANAIAAAAAMIPAAGPHQVLAEALRAAAAVLAVAAHPPIQAAAAIPVADPAAAPDPDHPPVGLGDGQERERPPVVINHCLVCLNHKEEMMLAVRCGHTAVCGDCVVNLIDESCMVCRAPIMEYVPIRVLH